MAQNQSQPAATTGAPGVRPDTLPEQRIYLSSEEQLSGRLSAENLQLAAALLSCRGYVILKDALSQDFIATIGREMADIYQDCRDTMDPGETGADYASIHRMRRSARKRATFWYRKSRWRIFPRLAAPMNDPRLLANPFVAQILENLLGPGVRCQFVSSDTCLKGSILQSPHTDIDNDDVIVDNTWRARGYVVNVPVMECGLHNGPIEVWPGGSHMWPADLMRRLSLSPNIQDGRNPPVEALADMLPSIRVALSPGEIMIRDLAMWHRGTPNPTDEPRTMLTLAYFRRDFVFGYGDLEYSLDEQLYRDFDPRVQPYFAYHYNFRNRYARAKLRLRRRVGVVVKRWLGRPVNEQP